MSQFGVLVTWREVVGTEPTLPLLLERLAPFRLEAVLVGFSRLAAALQTWQNEPSFVTDQQFARQFLPTYYPAIRQLYEADDRSGVPPFIWETCLELQSGQEVKRSWGLLADSGVLPQQLLGELRGPREHRVRVFERVLHGPNRLDALTSSFLAGLLADQVGPGTFEHIDLLLPYLDRYPTALVWYGLCAGLHRTPRFSRWGTVSDGGLSVIS
jgi:hypothetical protein